MVRDANGAGQIFGAGHLVGEDGREQILGVHALDGRGHFASAAKTQEGQRAAGIPAPARGEHRRDQQGFAQHVFHGVGMQKLEHRLQRKGMLFAQRDDDAVVGGGGLQLEVEGAAEAFAQREAPGAVDARSEGRVQDQLHAARFVEEAFGDDRMRRRHGAERCRAGLQIGDGLSCAGFIESAFGGEKLR